LPPLGLGSAASRRLLIKVEGGTDKSGKTEKSGKNTTLLMLHGNFIKTNTPPHYHSQLIHFIISIKVIRKKEAKV